MPVLEIQCIGVIQGWSDNGVYDNRRCSNIPTKSSVIGMVASAMGMKRDADLTKLRELRMGVRVDQQGKVHEDYQFVHGESIETIQRNLESIGVEKAKEKASKLYKFKNKNNSYVIRKEYLTDARFLVFLEHESKDFLEEIAKALENPIFPTYFGRKNCIPMEDLVVGIYNYDILHVMKNADWIAVDQTKPKALQMYLEGDVDQNEIVREIYSRDVPVTFKSNDRRKEPRKYYQLKPVVFSIKSEGYDEYFDKVVE